MKNYNKKDFKPKKNDAWSIFKIMGEFVNGYEQMSAVGPCVSIFGSARTKAGTPHYALGVDVAKAIAEKGYGIITGGEVKKTTHLKGRKAGDRARWKPSSIVDRQ